MTLPTIPYLFLEIDTWHIMQFLAPLLLATNNSNIHSSPTTATISSSQMQITKLMRYAIKGLPGDELQSVTINSGDKTFEDDRRFALLKTTSRADFNEKDPEWLHKENFLCAFTAPELMSSFQSSYQVIKSGDDVKRIVDLSRRTEINDGKTDYKHVLGPLDLNTEKGRSDFSNYFSQLSDESLECVCQQQNENHTHQFGNTSSGVKKNGGDTRTVHLINEQTVKDVEEKIGISLNPIRFRPNIIVDNLEAWKEFDFVGKRLRIVKQGTDHNTRQIELKVLSRTVRCAGVGIDPTDPTKKIDIPQLLSKH